MKYEKELKWIWCLYDSPHIKDILDIKFSPKSACKKDFERLVNAPEKSKEFSSWFKKLIDFGVFVSVGKKSRGFRNNIVAEEYYVNVPNLVKYCKNNPLYLKAVKFSFRVRII